jgi:hypothetical protein
MDQHVKDAMAWSVKTQGVTVFDLTGEQKAKWDFFCEPITAKWIKDNAAKGLPAQAIVDDIRSIAKKYEAK